MTRDELADHFKAGFDALDSEIENWPDGAAKRRVARLARIAHGAMNEIKAFAVDEGAIEPYSGGDPKPEDS